MSDIDYEELFRSPLDEPDAAGDPGWAPLGVGLLVGVAAVLLVATFRGSDEQATDIAVESTTSWAPPVAVVVEASPFPSGYQEFVPGLGARAEEIVIGDDAITVAFTTVVERGGEPLNQDWPIGGTWWLEAEDGSGAESDRVVLGRFSPGAFSVQFAADAFAGEPEFAEISLIERWDHPTVEGSSSVPFGGEPYVMPEPLIIPITSGDNLVVEELELGRFLGKVVWGIQGDTDPIGRVVINAVLFDTERTRIGAYSSFPELLEPANRGVSEIYWSEPFPTSQDGAVTVDIEYEVGLVEPVPAALTIDLDNVPVGR